MDKSPLLPITLVPESARPAKEGLTLNSNVLQLLEPGAWHIAWRGLMGAMGWIVAILALVVSISLAILQIPGAKTAFVSFLMRKDCAHELALWCMFLPGIGLLLGTMLKACRQNTSPTHVLITNSGIVAANATDNLAVVEAMTGSRPEEKAYGGAIILSRAWTEVARISLERNLKLRKPETLCFHVGHGNVKRLSIGDVMNQEFRQQLLLAISRHSQIVVDSDVMTLLEPQPLVGYTQLWFEALTAAPTRERMVPLNPGNTLRNGRYEIVSCIGGGGQGTAYLAKDLQPNGIATLERTEKREPLEVVLKEYVLPLQLGPTARKRAVESLEHEIRIVQRLDHPNIVKLLDFFIEDQRGYLVLEHVSGLNLRQQVEQNGPLDEAKTLVLLRMMGEILQCLHGSTPPIVHRDFTPDNLLIQRNGTLKLIDFNVAHEVLNSITAIVAGKPAYMPREQIKGLPDTRSDIYALGACLHFLLTGKESQALTVSHPRDTNPAVTAELDALVARCTEQSIEKRYSNVQELLAAVEALSARTYRSPVEL